MQITYEDFEKVEIRVGTFDSWQLPIPNSQFPITYSLKITTIF